MVSPSKFFKRFWKQGASLAVAAIGISSLYTNCGRAVLGSLSASSANPAQAPQSVNVDPGSCPLNQVAVGLTSSQTVICVPTQTVPQNTCPNGSSIYQILNGGGLLCVTNTSWDQPGSICPVGSYLTGYSSTGAIQCSAPSGGGNPLNFTCPAGQYLSGFANNQAVCLPLPPSTPTAFICPNGKYLQSMNGTTPVCADFPWTGSTTKSCPQGTFAVGYLNGNLVCAQQNFGVGVTVQCPVDQVLISVTGGTPQCQPIADIDVTHACSSGRAVLSIVNGNLSCQDVPSGVPPCAAGQYLIGLNNGAPLCGAIGTHHLPGSCPDRSYPFGISNGALVCVNFSNVTNPPLLCFPGDKRLCAIDGGIGNQTCANTGESYGSCVASQCFSGYLLHGDHCEAMECTPGSSQNCSQNHGSGTQYCGTTGAWGLCQVQSCDSGYFLKSGQCAPEICVPGSTQNCTVENGYGYQICLSDGSSLSSCTVTSCQNGYTLDPQTHVCKDTSAPRITFSAQPANPTVGKSGSATFAVIDNESGVKDVSCFLDGAPFTPCTSPADLSPLFNGSHSFEVRATDQAGNAAKSSVSWSNQVCNQGSSKACPMANGIGSSQCQADGTYGNCEATSCFPGYRLMDKVCQALNCNPGYDIDGNNCVDKTAPVIQILQAPLDPTLSSSATVQFSATDAGSGVATVSCQVDQAAAAPCASPLNLTNLSWGAHQLTIQAQDASGNASQKAVNWRNLACQPGTQAACGITNGQGQQTCKPDGSGYGLCSVTSCQDGYMSNGVTCVYQPKSCPLPWGGVVLSGVSVTAYGQAAATSCTSEIRTCNDGVLSGSYTSPSCRTMACSPGSTASCPVTNGTGIVTCAQDGSGYGSCVAKTCDPGYTPTGSTCTPTWKLSGDLPFGSYRNTCTSCSVSGNMLTCYCGGWGLIPWWYGWTSADWTQCPYGLANYWANLICEGGPTTTPGGSGSDSLGQ